MLKQTAKKHKKQGIEVKSHIKTTEAIQRIDKLTSKWLSHGIEPIDDKEAARKTNDTTLNFG